MELQEIEIVIDSKGQVEILVRGAKGAACLDITSDLEKALGGLIQSREMTPESKEGPNPIGSSIEIRS